MENPAAATIDVWVVEPDAALPADHERGLDDVERRRALALPPDQAARFVCARVLLRRAVGAMAGVDPRDVALVARCPTCGGPHGPVRVLAPVRVLGPAGMPPLAGLAVSVTRSGPLAAVAVAHHAVGIDVESRGAIAAAPLADVALAPAERARHDRLPAAARGEHLARTWVRKEAVLKALGTGLVTDPAAIALAEGPGGPRVVGRPEILLADLSDLAGMLGAVGAVALLLPEAPPEEARRPLVVRTRTP